MGTLGGGGGRGGGGDGSTASGSARIERAPSGRVVVLTVEGLTFSVSGPRPITMRWATGADTAQYRLDVTLEHTDGNPLARGPEVLKAAEESTVRIRSH